MAPPAGMCSTGELFGSQLGGYACTGGDEDGTDSNWGMEEGQCVSGGGTWTAYDCSSAESYWINDAGEGIKDLLRETWEPKCCYLISDPDGLCQGDNLDSDMIAGYACVGGSAKGQDSNFGGEEDRCVSGGGTWIPYNCASARDYFDVQTQWLDELRGVWAPKCCSNGSAPTPSPVNPTPNPTSKPTPTPTPRPTLRPTPRPTNAPKPSGGCFSLESTVNIREKGISSMDQVQIGDYVQNKKDGSFSKVFALHINHDTPTEFYKIDTATRSLELTETHMLYIDGKSLPKAAKNVNIGDLLATMEGPQVVQSISKVIRNGFITPVTEDGSVIVDGVVASSFTTFGEGGLFSNDFVPHHQTLSNFAISPVRFVCKAVWSGFCTDEAFVDSENLHKYIKFTKRAKREVLIVPVVVGLGIGSTLLEYLYDSSLVLVALATILILKFNHKSRSMILSLLA